MPTPELHIDVLIFGGGIAGLWTLARLRREGYSCVLLENKALGAGQTIASQGIIHGGIKYALTGKASAASKAIAEMPGIWQACLEGRGEIDLRAAHVLSPHQHLWTTAGIGSRLVGVAASKVIRTAVEPVPTDQRPAAFTNAPRGVDIYTVEEPVLEPQSVVRALADQIDAPIIFTDPERTSVSSIDENGRSGVQLTDPRFAEESQRVTLIPKHWVLTAGAGNKELRSRLAVGGHGDGPPIGHQLRPLHMVMARGDLPLIYGHCVGLSDKPRITITSQKHARTGNGRTIWYIGGQIAETGVARSEIDQIVAARAEVSACVPWVNLAGVQWSTLRIDRAEGSLHPGANERPDEPVVIPAANLIVAYPTKLAFAPLLAEQVAATLASQEIRPAPADLSVLRHWPRPPIAPLPWDREGVIWT